MRFSGASPPRAPRPRSPGRAAARSARTRAVGPGGGNPPSGLRLLLDRGLERQLLLGGEQPRGVEDDDRAAVLHDEPRDVVSREPLDETSRCGAATPSRLRRSMSGTAAPWYCSTPSRKSGALGSGAGAS